MLLPITPDLGNLYTTLYPIGPPDRSAKRAAHPLQVLNLGLSRSGTDSLRAALTTLGYNNVYHGWVISFSQRSDPAIWCPLMQRKYAGDFTASTRSAEELREEFDKVIGNCEAITDVPCFVFAEELIKAYPEAKVVLNRRELEAWFKSMQDTAIAVFTWPLFVLHFFDTELFWLYRVFELAFVVWARGNFERFGKEVAVEHYARLEEVCRRTGREYLEWRVEEGWEPLCKFLGREVPSEKFPWVNKAGEAFEKKAEAAIGKIVKRAARNLGLLVGGLVVLAGVVSKVLPYRG
jgi:Sulfotransferase domain